LVNHSASKILRETILTYMGQVLQLISITDRWYTLWILLQYASTLHVKHQHYYTCHKNLWE